MNQNYLIFSRHEKLNKRKICQFCLDFLKIILNCSIKLKNLEKCKILIKNLKANKGVIL